MVQKYVIDKADIHNLLTGKEIPLGQGSKARAFCVEIAGGMTNGELFQAIFPCDEIAVNGLQEGYVHFSMKSNSDSMDCFSLEWWNAPYKAENIDPNNLSFMFDGVTAFKGWTTEEMLDQIRAEREEKSNGKNE